MTTTSMFTEPPAPTLDTSVALLTDLAVTEAEDELAELADWVNSAHRGHLRRKPDGSYGACRYCGDPWPCWQWQWVADQTLAWLVTASTRAVRRARQRELSWRADA